MKAVTRQTGSAGGRLHADMMTHTTPVYTCTGVMNRIKQHRQVDAPASETRNKLHVVYKRVDCDVQRVIQLRRNSKNHKIAATSARR